MMGDPSGAINLDPSAWHPTFLSRFDLLELNSLPVGHFFYFRACCSSFLCFSMPTIRFREGLFLGNILLKLLCAILISLKNTLLKSLFEEKLLEWRKVVRDLVEVKNNLSFLLRYLQLMALAFFQRKATKYLDTEIAIVKEVLACTQGVLQELEAWKKQALSTIATSSSPMVPQEYSFFTGLLL